MAVAIKTSPGAKPGSTTPSPAVPSLVGVAFVVACLALLFGVVPAFWGAMWSALGLQAYSLLGNALLLGLSVVLAGFLIVAGGRVASAQPAVGVRAGTFVGMCALLLVLLLTRWASLWVEHWSFGGMFSPTTGVITTGIIGGLILLLALRVFLSKTMQRFIIGFEEAGWFSTKTYKSNQGQVVRRGTIFGILLLAGAGIYTLLMHNTLRRYGPDLALNIPFTGAVALEWYGDALPLIGDPMLVPDSAKSMVEVHYPGNPDVTRLRAGQQMTVQAYKERVKGLVEAGEKGGRHLSLTTAHQGTITEALDKEPAHFLTAVNEVIWEKIEFDLRNNAFDADTTKSIRAQSVETDLADMSPLVARVNRESKERTIPANELGLPIAVLLVDRFAMREVKSKLREVDSQGIEKPYTVVLLPGSSKTLEAGKAYPPEVFEDEVRRLREDPTGPQVPVGRPARQPGGQTRYATLTLLPAIQYTVPLLLIAVAIWFAWRAVNMPAFADFLIATEAEMNKVSWTTQKRLIQDTVVVLVTVLLMAVFLFLVDWGWKGILQTLRVLHIPREEPQSQIEKKRW
jgi:preprotein translocase SecE subunit